MSRLSAIADAIDRLNETIGRTVSWLALFMVLVQCVLVAMRYVFGVASIVIQESLVYAHGLLFTLAAGYTLLHDGHVRVDIFYREASPRRKALIDLLGVLFLLLPFCMLLWLTAWPYVGASWAILEGSREQSGIRGIYLLKSAILALAALIALQGLSLGIRSAAILAGARRTG
ncbi:MAG TPA: TRAP transporter small permease subunit [Alphaproteobacteria bacterium]|nr:TRAP transporter small permease subunit [Alphaproteobacteria bacterium]